MRTHPPTLLTLARRLDRERALFASGPSGARVLVAVSGGRDSMALLHVLATLGRDRALALFAHGVDHGLRAAASEELDLAERYAATLEIPFTRSRVRVTPGGNLQARARAARYEALVAAAAASSCDRIATAHHADDRAETVLLRLLRGAGARGLAVLPAAATPEDGVLRVRPLLLARRADIDAHVRRHAVPFADDPSNADARYLRARVRLELLPMLESLDPNVVAHLCALAEELALTEAPPHADLPRATQTALRVLAASRSPNARIALPGGLEVRVAPAAARRNPRSTRTSP